jgi:hypothetical protein
MSIGLQSTAIRFDLGSSSVLSLNAAAALRCIRLVMVSGPAWCGISTEIKCYDARKPRNAWFAGCVSLDRGVYGEANRHRPRLHHHRPFLI